MLEVLTATGLATAAGLNAGLPLLLLGAAARWTPLVDLPVGWTWLSQEWVLAVLAVLVVLDVVADKVPGLDHVNDLVQTVVRPTAGGLAFGAGVGSTTVAVEDPTALSDAGVWVPVALGVVLALAVHVTKSLSRPLVNAATLGVGGPVVSAVEDATSLSLSLAALLVPVLVVVLVAVVVAVVVRVTRRRRRPPPRARAALDEPAR
ncbi:DUF4126 domain-containing protein [Actinotalea sp. Marseille-Q4924]|uniref:DUF4126 domain-containing protein n=1 Tax=Actinotalea sp. Marseille-Q4924 TaxID=2866571 RepID=UPI001CE45C4A|nr:DUF4126 domain-containing protein [Actinotalea sp. Marseille-Q4924]